MEGRGLKLNFEGVKLFLLIASNEGRVECKNNGSWTESR